MTVLSTEIIYLVKFRDPNFISKNGFTGSSGNIRSQRYRALNCMLEVFDENGNSVGNIPWGISVTHNSLMRFFRSIGIFGDPDAFDPKELEGLEVKISVNNICDNHWGLRTVVDQFFPKNCVK